MKKKTTNQLLEQILHEISDLRKSLPMNISTTQTPFYKVISNQNNGEWCEKCGAWKQYGVADNHHCTGYKVTC